MVMITFGLIFNMLFKNPSDDSLGLGPLSYILMSLKIVWGEGSFDISNTEYKIIA